MRLIDADVAIDTLKELTANGTNKGMVFGEDAVHRIEMLPSVQSEPRTAYWTKDVVGTVVCSKCGGIRRDNRIGHTQWCNSCGCFMLGEQNVPETF